MTSEGGFSTYASRAWERGFADRELLDAGHDVMVTPPEWPAATLVEMHQGESGIAMS